MEVAQAHQAVPVSEASQPSSARFAARDLADSIGFDEADAHRVGLVATELATNLVKHAPQGDGQILLRASAAAEIEILSIDRGPGMRDVARCLSDGHSTSGTPGNGLGAVRRLADAFDVFSEPGRGTIVLARLRARRAAAPINGFEIGAVSVASRGETVCGDGWYVERQPNGLVAMVVDGLGHGIYAWEAAAAAIDVLKSRPFDGTAEALERIHAGLRHTRGAAATIVQIRKSGGVVALSGIGNVAAAICGPGTIRQGVTQNGTLGHEARNNIREFTYPWSSNSLLVLHSDGLTSRWSLDEYRGLRQKHPSVVAAALYRDFYRQRDDVTILVGRETPP